MNLRTKVTFFIPNAAFKEVTSMIRQERVYHWPFTRATGGYLISIENGPVASYLGIKYP